jgi:hypothetical protein
MCSLGVVLPARMSRDTGVSQPCSSEVRAARGVRRRAFCTCQVVQIASVGRARCAAKVSGVASMFRVLARSDPARVTMHSLSAPLAQFGCTGRAPHKGMQRRQV